MGVLVAISIPIFSSQLEKSRDAVTLANLRSAYAEAQSAYLTGSDGGNAKVNKDANGAITSVDVSNVVSKGEKDGLDGLEEMTWIPAGDRTTLAGKASLGGTAKNTWTITFTYTDSEITGVSAK